MKRKWIKNSDFNYTLVDNEKEIGKMEIQFNAIASKAICTIDGKVLEIRRTGFWKSNLEISDDSGIIILKTYPEKWYANASIVEFQNETYKLIVRNNPLAEYAITQNEKTILAYGLATKENELSVRVSTSGDQPLIFEFLLWYLFLPIANENSGDNYLFLVTSPS